MNRLPLNLIAGDGDRKGTKHQWTGCMGRTQAAKLLAVLASQVAEGRVESAAGSVSLPDDLVVEIELKMRPKGNKLEVELKWPAADETFSPEIMPQSAQTPVEAVPRQATFRQLKSSLKSEWKQALAFLREGHIPDSELIRRIEDLAQASIELAEPGWRSGMGELVTGLRDLRSAAVYGDLAACRDIVAHLDGLRRDYHRLLKR